MYCSKCGKEITDSSVFCNYCGQRTSIENDINLISLEMTYTPNEAKKDELLYNLESVMKPVKNIEIYYYNLHIAQKRLESWEKNKGIGEIIGISLAGSIFLSFWSSIFIVSFLDIEKFLFVVFGIIAVAIFAILIRVYGKYVKNRRQKAIEKYSADISKNQEYGTKTLERIYPLLIQTLPENYWYSHAIEYIYSYIKNGRAATIKEALNLYEEEMHRARMEDMQNRILIQNQKQTTYAAITAFNTFMSY